MAVTDFTWIADRFGRNCFKSFFVNITGRTLTQQYTEAKLIKEGKPQRIIFVHIKYAWNSYITKGCILRFTRCIMKKPFIFPGKKIWQGTCIISIQACICLVAGIYYLSAFFFACSFIKFGTLFAAVTGYKGPLFFSRRKSIYCKETIVLAFTTTFKLQRNLKVFKIGQLCNTGTNIMKSIFGFSGLWHH